MENIILSISVFLLGMLGLMLFVGRGWNTTFRSFLFADRSLSVGTTGLAISAHWFWAIAIFVGPAVAYNWGIIGLLWFVIPNALSLVVVGFLTRGVRENYPEGYSLTRYVKENFSNRVSGLYQLEFVLVAFAALLLAFTAIGKLWAFTNLSATIEPIYASLAVGLVTLAFTLRGGLRTSIFTGTVQTVLWLVLLGGLSIAIYNSGLPYLSYGKNALDTVFNEKFITTFAIAWFIPIMVGATGHGMMWQKAFSMPKENIMPSFLLGAVIFAIVTFAIAQLGMFAFANGMVVGAPDTSQMIAMTSLLGTAALVAFATILIGQTSTVIDSALNYISSLISMEWLKKEQVNTSRLIMVGFMLLAWVVSWLKLEIWTIVMLMGCVRISMFVPIALHILRVRLQESAVFYLSILAVVGSFYFAYTARIAKLPIFDMYSVLFAFFVPLTGLILVGLFSKNKSA